MKENEQDQRGDNVVGQMAHLFSVEIFDFQDAFVDHASSNIEFHDCFPGLFMKPRGQESWDRKANELLARMSKALDRKAGSATRNLDYMFF